jgi:hypothetical protein
MNSSTEGSPNGVELHQPSRSIPLPDSHIIRTHSEQQLIEDVAVAEGQELCMFYRVVSGIRERQNSRGGVPIYEQRYGRLENSYPPTWTNPRVFPFESSTGDSPLQHGDRVGGSVALLIPSMPTSIQKDNEWSITGFDEDTQELCQYAIIEEDTSDNAVFEMDL